MTLLTIIGEDISRIIPLLYAYKDRAKHHILLCDDDISNYERAKTLKKGMQRFSAKHSLGWYTHIVTTDEDSASQIEQVAKRQFKYKGELWLNATDGYPAMTILLSDHVRKEGGKILSYDHFDNDLHIIEPNGTMKTEELKSKIDLESYLMLLNYTIVDKQTIKTLLSHKNDILALYKNEKKFIQARTYILEKHFKQHYDKDYTLPEYIKAILIKLNILNNYGTLIPSQQKTLQGDIFEEYLFWLCEETKPDDIALGVKIDFDDHSQEPNTQKRVYNEFDILMMNNNRIYTVECKLSKNLEGLEIVYKYDAIIDYFGKASKAIIANISSKDKEHYLNTKASSNFKHSTLRRARMAGVAVYHEAEIDVTKFQDLVRDFFGIEED